MLADYKTILYATDLSLSARPVFRHAVGHAEKYGAKIHIIHVVPEIDTSHYQYLSALVGEKMINKQDQKRHDEILNEIKKRVSLFAHEELAHHPDRLEALAGIEVLHGNPVDLILEAAERLDADLVVMGTHGKGFMEYAFLGSIALKVLRRIKRPVLIAPITGE